MKRRLLYVILAGTIVSLPLVNMNVAKAAEENITIQNKEFVSEQALKEGEIIKDYIKLQKKHGNFYYRFTKDDSLEERLASIGSSIRETDVEKYIRDLNTQLEKENGDGPITTAIKEIRKYKNKFNSSQSYYGSYLKGNPCSRSLFWLGLGTGGFYTAVGFLATGPAGIAIGLTGYAVGAAIGAMSEYGC